VREELAGRRQEQREESADVRHDLQEDVAMGLEAEFASFKACLVEFRAELNRRFDSLEKGLYTNIGLLLDLDTAMSALATALTSNQLADHEARLPPAGGASVRGG
jgi:hypothetical protein